MLLYAGPCVIESRQHALECAHAIREQIPDGYDWFYKSSFDKANRTSMGSFRGPGINIGLDILEELKAQGFSTITDIHEPWQAAEAARVVDVLQIPAFLCRQTDLLLAAKETGKPVNIKKGQFMSPDSMKYVVEKCPGTITERGTCFGYSDLVVDYRGIVAMRSFAPVIFDATHSVQKMGMGSSSGGLREYIPYLARAACAVGIDGLFIETHPDPDKALSDAATQWPISKLKELLDDCLEHYNLRLRTSA